MNIPCRHWSACGLKEAGCCAIKALGARTVSLGACLDHCPYYSGPPEQRQILSHQLTTIRPPKTQRGHHPGCGGVKIVQWPHIQIGRWRWSGIRWFGMPYPERLVWWTYSTFTVPPSTWPGCGCIVKLKAAWVAAKGWWKVVKNA